MEMALFPKSKVLKGPISHSVICFFSHRIFWISCLISFCFHSSNFMVIHGVWLYSSGKFRGEIIKLLLQLMNFCKKKLNVICMMAELCRLVTYLPHVKVKGHPRMTASCFHTLRSYVFFVNWSQPSAKA